jgi:aryl-alcohol dehydrogenase-like predicted oxidoreductase
MELALGTVQFGLLYGIGGGKRLLADHEIREILELAFRRGMKILDTAPVYGDIESRLGRLCQGLEFQVISKIPPIPQALDNNMAAQWAVESAQVSLERLGRKLHALLFHRDEDLFGARGDIVSQTVVEWAKTRNILIGASSYDVATIRSLSETHRISIAQLPGNALDQRIEGAFAALNPKPELHLRSAFLQGLLLLPVEDAIRLLPTANSALRQWHQWLGDRGMSPLQGALSVVKSFEDVATCVVGIDNIGQLKEITNAWREAQPIRARELARTDPQLIDPRLWGTGKQ